MVDLRRTAHQGANTRQSGRWPVDLSWLGLAKEKKNVEHFFCYHITYENKRRKGVKYIIFNRPGNPCVASGICCRCFFYIYFYPSKVMFGTRLWKRQHRGWSCSELIAENVKRGGLVHSPTLILIGRFCPHPPSPPQQNGGIGCNGVLFSQVPEARWVGSFEA